MVPLSKQVFYIQQCFSEDMCSYSQQCVEENTVLRQGRIILWARGSLADDGSTVSKQLFYIHQCLDEDMNSYSQVCGRKHSFDTRQNNPVGRR